MTIPDALTENSKFAALLRRATFGATDAERDDIETLIAAAYLQGQSAGVQQARDIIKGAGA